jgi:hypothetical protein
MQAQNKAEVLSKQLENIRYLCYQLIHYQSDFKNDFPIKTENDKEISESITELFNTLQNDAFASADLIYEMLNNEDELE